VREVTGDGNREFQLLAAYELSVRDALAAARDNTVLDGQLTLVHVELGRSKIEEGLIRVSRRFANVLPAVLEKAGGKSSIRRSIRIAHHDSRDGLEGNVQLFGDELLVCRMSRGLPEIHFPRTHQERVVGVNFEPGVRQRRVERVLSGGGFRRLFEQ